MENRGQKIADARTEIDVRKRWREVPEVYPGEDDAQEERTAGVGEPVRWRKGCLGGGTSRPARAGSS